MSILKQMVFTQRSDAVIVIKCWQQKTLTQ